ncbi:hypothetical protein COO60DRAFT_680507 [Scenedesmus sp. NREL 46B-D3]|nr:hypothetical protein COO60DRAFT_680507 [Scenedesmus sp. NREL 46B-D3]
MLLLVTAVILMRCRTTVWATNNGYLLEKHRKRKRGEKTHNYIHGFMSVAPSGRGGLGVDIVLAFHNFNADATQQRVGRVIVPTRQPNVFKAATWRVPVGFSN